MATPSKPLRLLFIACAGISTFYVSAQLSRSHRAAGDDVVEEVARAAAPGSKAASSPSSVSVPSPAPVPAADAAASGLLVDRTKTIPRTKGTPFASLSWLPPPPPPPPPLPPPPPPPKPQPVTPPLPFSFVGLLERGAARPQAFLAKGDALLVVGAGDMLDNNTYRVDALNANEVVMTYLPTNVQQTLNVSGRSK